MKLKEFKEKNLECEDCEIFQSGDCPGGIIGINGGYQEPPCVIMDDECEMSDYCGRL